MHCLNQNRVKFSKWEIKARFDSSKNLEANKMEGRKGLNQNTTRKFELKLLSARN